MSGAPTSGVVEFVPGDIFEYQGHEYLVLESRGFKGTVRSLETGKLYDPFYWIRERTAERARKLRFAPELVTSGASH